MTMSQKLRSNLCKWGVVKEIGLFNFFLYAPLNLVPISLGSQSFLYHGTGFFSCAFLCFKRGKLPTHFPYIIGHPITTKE